jgi:tetratricopeptide (TPR) repeat protein
MIKPKSRKVNDKSDKVLPLTATVVANTLQEAAIHRVAERYDEALTLYKRLELSNPQEVDPPYFIALIDLALGRPAASLPRLERLARRLPNQHLVWLTYAHALRELGRWQESVTASRHALELTPQDTGEQFSLATALEVAGDLHGALVVLRALASNPETRLAALSNITRIAPASIGPKDLEDIAIGAARPSASAEARAGLYFALGPLLERQGDYDASFAAFAEGARLKRSVLTGSAAADPRPTFSEHGRMLHPDEAERIGLEETSYIKTVCSAEFMAEEQGQGSHLATPIFIVGMPRSGSTLIEQIISTHPKVQGLGETSALFNTLAGKYPLQLLAPRGPDHYRELAQCYLATMHQRGWNNSARLIDKMLNNFVFVGLIHLMFPRATILHAMRDPVDTCLSNFRTPFLSGHEESYDLTEIGRSYVRYRQMMEHWDKVLPGRVIDVDHDALVTDPENRIRWLVTEACGLNWTPACLEFYKTKRPVRTASMTQVRQPIFTSSVQRWRRYEKHLGPLFDALGPYAPPRT